MPAPVPNVAYADFKLPPVIKSRDLRKRCQRRADFAVDKVVELVSKWSSSLVLLILQLQALLISLFSAGVYAYTRSCAKLIIDENQHCGSLRSRLTSVVRIP